MSERQKHGFEYEKKCFKKNPHWISNSDEYTAKWDAYDTIEEKPVSIKCIKLGSSVEFGDIFRMTSIKEDWILQVGFWSKKKNNIVEEYTIPIDVGEWKKLIGNIKVFHAAKREMAKITNEYKDDNKWKKFRTKYKKLWGDSILQPRFKRDHGNQKRLQCAIMYNNLLEHFVKREKKVDISHGVEADLTKDEFETIIKVLELSSDNGSKLPKALIKKVKKLHNDLKDVD